MSVAVHEARDKPSKRTVGHLLAVRPVSRPGRVPAPILIESLMVCSKRSWTDKALIMSAGRQLLPALEGLYGRGDSCIAAALSEGRGKDLIPVRLSV